MHGSRLRVLLQDGRDAEWLDALLLPFGRGGRLQAAQEIGETPGQWRTMPVRSGQKPQALPESPRQATLSALASLYTLEDRS